MDPNPPSPTSVGRFRIDAVLGRGGMGEVYKAYDPTLHRTVALKTVRPGIESRDFLDRLYREAQACARLTHPHIVTVFEAGEINGAVYIAMEYVTGENLATILRQGSLRFDERLQIILQMLEALQAAHEGGVIHRDVKPANVIRQPNGSIKLVDFGLARTEDSEPLTATGIVMGTLDYASPEQLRGEHVDHRSDIYSTGVVAYELMAGRRPFVRNTDIPALIYKIVHEPPPPLNEYLRTTFPSLDAIISRAIAKEPDDRYLSAIAMHEALKAFVEESREQIASIQLALAQAPDPDARTGERQRSRPPTTTRPEHSSDAPTIPPPGRAAPVVTAATAAPGNASGRTKAWIAGGLAIAAAAFAAVFLFRSSSTVGSSAGDRGPGTDPILVADASHAPTGDRLAPGAPLAPPSAAPKPAAPIGPAANVGESRASTANPASSADANAAPPLPLGAAAAPSAKDLFEGAASGAPVRTGLRYRVIQIREDETEIEVDPATTIFRTGDRARLGFDANIDGFLYVVSLGSSGRWTLLFPDPEINRGRNAIRSGKEYAVPDADRDGWFTFTDKAGDEQLFVFLSRQPMMELPGFDRPVTTKAETVVAAAVVEDLRQRFPSRDLVFQKAPRNSKGPPNLSTYVVNRTELGQAVAATITLKHGE